MIGERPLWNRKTVIACAGHGRRTPSLPAHLGIQTIVDGQLAYCAHLMFFPVLGYEFDIRNCDGCDVFKPRRQPGGAY
ncbi:MAG: hypothetical protein R2712_02035 [Vicinamibacterales bacterium]